MRKLPSFCVTKNLPSGIAAILHGFDRDEVIIFVVYAVVVLLPATLVCPVKTGLYCGLFGDLVSTGARPSEELEVLVEEQPTKKISAAAAKNIFFMHDFFDVSTYKNGARAMREVRRTAEHIMLIELFLLPGFRHTCHRYLILGMYNALTSRNRQGILPSCPPIIINYPPRVLF
jgi:hypothetical protein